MSIKKLCWDCNVWLSHEAIEEMRSDLKSVLAKLDKLQPESEKQAPPVHPDNCDKGYWFKWFEDVPENDLAGQYLYYVRKDSAIGKRFSKSGKTREDFISTYDITMNHLKYWIPIHGKPKWEKVPSEIPCCLCGGKVVEFTVPNELWNMVMRPGEKETDKEYLCWDCWNKRLQDYISELKECKSVKLAESAYGMVDMQMEIVQLKERVAELEKQLAEKQLLISNLRNINDLGAETIKNLEKQLVEERAKKEKEEIVRPTGPFPGSQTIELQDIQISALQTQLATSQRKVMEEKVAVVAKTLWPDKNISVRDNLIYIQWDDVGEWFDPVIHEGDRMKIVEKLQARNITVGFDYDGSVVVVDDYNSHAGHRDTPAESLIDAAYQWAKWKGE